MKNADVGKLLSLILDQVSTLLRETAIIEQNSNTQSQKKKETLEDLIEDANDKIKLYQKYIDRARKRNDTENETINEEKIAKKQKKKEQLQKELNSLIKQEAQ